MSTLEKLTYLIECPYYKSEDTRDWLCHMGNILQSFDTLNTRDTAELDRLFVLYKDMEHEDLNAIG